MKIQIKANAAGGASAQRVSRDKSQGKSRPGRMRAACAAASDNTASSTSLLGCPNDNAVESRSLSRKTSSARAAASNNRTRLPQTQTPSQASPPPAAQGEI